MGLGQGAHLYGIVGNEGGLDVGALAELAEDFVNQLALAHGVVNLHLEFLADLADFLFTLIAQVVAGLLLDGLEDRQATEGGLEADGLAIDFHVGRAVHLQGDTLQQLLGKAHHPVVILVLYVELHAGELRVVVLVHTLVAEVLADFIYALKAAHDEPLEVELGSNTEVEVDVERVVVGDEGACAGSAGNGLQDRGLDLGIAGFVKHGTHGLDDL